SSGLVASVGNRTRLQYATLHDHLGKPGRHGYSCYVGGGTRSGSPGFCVDGQLGDCRCFVLHSCCEFNGVTAAGKNGAIERSRLTKRWNRRKRRAAHRLAVRTPWTRNSAASLVILKLRLRPVRVFAGRRAELRV